MKHVLILAVALFLAGAPLVSFAADPAASPAPAAQTQSTGASSGNATPSFVPLTSIPGFGALGSTPSLPTFFNSLYKLCIGVAAVLAVLQIMRAGLMYMGGDSVTEKREAKNLIAMSLVGLLLVLSPVIVFSIINPKILSLNIDTSGLTPSPTANINFLSPEAQQAGNDAARAAQGDGTCAFDCNTGKTCRQGQCVDAATAPPIPQQCTNIDIDGYGKLPAGKSCADVYQDGDTSVPVMCCDNSGSPEAGYTCCAHSTNNPVAAPTPTPPSTPSPSADGGGCFISSGDEIKSAAGRKCCESKPGCQVVVRQGDFENTAYCMCN